MRGTIQVDADGAAAIASIGLGMNLVCVYALHHLGVNAGLVYAVCLPSSSGECRLIPWKGGEARHGLSIGWVAGVSGVTLRHVRGCARTTL